MKTLDSANPFWEFDYRKIVGTISDCWIGMVVALVLSWGLAWLYLSYTPALYTTRMALKIENNRSEISELIQVKNRFYPQEKIQSEKFIIQSYRVRVAAAKSLNYPVYFYKHGPFHLTEVYPEKPLEIKVIERSAHFFQGLLAFQTIGKNQLNLSLESNGRTIHKNIRYGTTVSLPGIKFKVCRANHLPSNGYFKFTSEEVIAERLSKGLQFEEPEDDGILHLKLTDTNAYFAADVLNCLGQAYLGYNSSQRSASASQTIRFIDTLLYGMRKAVSSTGKAVEDFKVKHRFLDLSVHAEQQMIQLTALESERKHLEMELLNLHYIEKNISNSATSEPINFNIQGNTDPMLAVLIQQFNQWLLQKKEIGMAYQSGSLPMKSIEDQLRELKLAIAGNIRMQVDKKRKSKSYVDAQISDLKERYQSLPVAEKGFIKLKSAFDVNQKVFNYLSEKQLEAQIARAAATPSAVIVDDARPSFEVVSPKPGKVLTIATLGGFSVSLLFIFVLKMLKPYIRDRVTLEELTDIHIIGHVSAFPPAVASSTPKIVTVTHPNTPFAETIRSIRTHLSFLASDQLSKIICISSEASGEGKSLISLNLAGALAMLDKRVIIVATDLRKPELHPFFKPEKLGGLSDYLASCTDMEDVIFSSPIKNLSFITAGSIPPNPGELLLSERMKELLEKLKKEYAFIVLDTAPIGLISDALPLMKSSDINLFIIRAGYSRYTSAALPGKLKQSCALDNLYLVLNDVKPDFPYNSYYRGGYHG